MKRIIRLALAVFWILHLAGCMTAAPIEDPALMDIEQAQTEEYDSQESFRGNGGQDMHEGERRVICWGDSLTYGEGGNGVTYPSTLKDRLNCEVINYGIQGETVTQIGIRTGAFPMSVGAFEIPSDPKRVKVSLWMDGEDPNMMRLGDAGINPCTIAGIEGTLSYSQEENSYYFTRATAGDPLSVEKGTEVETFAAKDKRKSDVVILFAGTNLAPDRAHIGELIDAEKQILEYLDAKAYLVVGLTSLAMAPDVVWINQALAAEFGERFLDIRTYLLQHGLEDAGIQPTLQDRQDLADGEIPSSLRVDIVHGNESFYRIIGEQVMGKLQELGMIGESDEK